MAPSLGSPYSGVSSALKEVIHLVDYCLVAVIGFVLFVLTIVDLVDELKR